MRWFKWTVIVTVFVLSFAVGLAATGPLALLIWGGLLVGPMRWGLRKDFPGGAKSFRQRRLDRERTTEHGARTV